MMAWLFLIFSLTVFADAPIYWSSAFKISERHEFYPDSAVVEKPKDSWQVLFAVVYPDSQLGLHKDCVLYRVPGKEPGELKITKLPESTPCESVLFKPADHEWKSIKSLEFATNNNTIELTMILPKYKSEVWNVKLINLGVQVTPAMNMSSVEYKSPKTILLAPGTMMKDMKPHFSFKNGDLCHEVSDNCEAKPSRCIDCPSGWYEIPNGCVQGPKYCGHVECGTKNAPACRRGIEWQKTKTKFSCVDDTSFAICSPGLKIQCEGTMAWCR